MKKSIVLLILFSLGTFVFGQSTIYLDTLNQTAHARGLKCSNGIIYLGDNLGRCFSFHPLTQALTLLDINEPEIRDVEVNSKGILNMQTGNIGKIFFTGAVDPLLYPKVNNEPVFLDGLAVKDSLVFAMGDPVDGYFQLYLSSNYGLNWSQINGVKAHEGEAAYAASGSTVQIKGDRLYFVTGGSVSRIFIGKKWEKKWKKKQKKKQGWKWKSRLLPFKSAEGEGPYSLCVVDKRNLVAVGGNYLYPNRRTAVCFVSKNGGRTWDESGVPPFGYRSCVMQHKGVTYACGPTGLDFSFDGGRIWTSWLKDSFMAMDILSDEKLCLTTSKKLGVMIIDCMIHAVPIGN